MGVKPAISLWEYDSSCYCRNSGLVGVDEAGRGCLAGPVVAAAVWVSPGFFDQKSLRTAAGNINDSKQLAAEVRESQYALLESWAERDVIRFRWAAASVEEIDRLNILGATRLAMQRALEALGTVLPRMENDLPLFQETENPAFVPILVDGRPLKPFPYAHRAVVQGDGKSLAIASASIVAKVNRDRLMWEGECLYPGYGFARHKGYGTAEHREALHRQGPSPWHRPLFLRKILG